MNSTQVAYTYPDLNGRYGKKWRILEVLDPENETSYNENKYEMV